MRFENAVLRPWLGACSAKPPAPAGVHVGGHTRHILGRQ